MIVRHFDLDLYSAAKLALEIIVVLVVVREIRALRRTDEVMKGSVESIGKAVDTLGSSMRLLERDKIYFYLSETAREAKERVLHLSLSHATLEIDDEDERERVREFIQALELASKNKREVKILGPDLSSRIGGLWERQRCGCEVRASPRVAGYDVRIQIVDGQRVVIGVGPPQTRSQHGFLVESYVLSAMLEDDFRALWRTAKDLNSHVADVVVRQVGLCLPLQTLKGILCNLLYVSDQMADEIIKMTIDSKRLLQEGTTVYDVSKVDQLCTLSDLSDGKLRQSCEGFGFLIYDNDFDKLATLIRSRAAALQKPAGMTTREGTPLA